ncbi:hypothetical protein XENTR_v10000563 [Xenopus tropicalis]|nr:hypothetical protein XENTR_v10000563 [Xenopus tropicalis]
MYIVLDVYFHMILSGCVWHPEWQVRPEPAVHNVVFHLLSGMESQNINNTPLLICLLMYTYIYIVHTLFIQVMH